MLMRWRARYMRAFIAVLAMMIIGLVTGTYIVVHQRLHLPFVTAKTYKLEAEFTTAAAVVPGQGQTVRVSGVRIGDITGVHLEDGRAVVTMSIDSRYAPLIKRDARALLRPRTGLKDMFVELAPGSPRTPHAPDGWRIPVSRTAPDVNLDEILSSLDGDTRAYLKTLLADLGHGLDGRGLDLREVLRRFEPTHRELARVQAALAERRHNLRRLVHSMSGLSTRLAQEDGRLTKLVTASAATFHAFASEHRNLSSAVQLLPGTLRQTTDTLGRVERFADLLGPTLESLRPTLRATPAAGAQIRPFARAATPILRTKIRPFTRDASTLLEPLTPGVKGLADATPDLGRSMNVLNALFNMLGYNPRGREGPEVAGREEGFLFWIAWVNHMSGSVFSMADANGPFRRALLVQPCSNIRREVEQSPGLEFLENLTPLLTDPSACGK